MLFNDASAPIFHDADLAIMQDALNLAALILGICPKTNAYAEMAARKIIDSYIAGVFDVAKLANLATRHVLKLKRQMRQFSGSDDGRAGNETTRQVVSLQDQANWS